MPSPSRSTFAADVIPVVGQAAAAELVRQLGGTTFPVPKSGDGQGAVRYLMLAAVAGEEAASALCYHFGGTDLYIPRDARGIQKQRDTAINEEATRAIRAGRALTAIVNELALKYKLTDRRVWDILKTVPKVDNQLGLF